jgi:hypothetical protein
MTQPIRIHDDTRELDYRASDGIEVRLLWTPGDEDVVVEVVDQRLNDRFRLHVAGKDALAAFRHPYGFTATAQQAA